MDSAAETSVPISLSELWRGQLEAIEQASTRRDHRSDLNGVLNFVLAKLSEMFSPSWSAAWLFDPDEEIWEISASTGMTPAASAVRFGIGGAIPCRVGERGIPLLVDNLDVEDFHRSCQEHYRMRSAMYSPMRVGKEAVGVLAVYSENVAAYSAEDLELLTAVGDHLGIAVAFSIMERRARRIAVLEERDRQARDLHDGIGQILCSLRIWVLEASHYLDQDREHARFALGELMGTIDEASEELREAISTLRQETSGVDFYDVARRTQVRIESAGIAVEMRIDHLDLLPATSDGLSWVLREATNNLLRHSNAERARIFFHRDCDEAVLRVDDNGDGFDLAEVKPSNGFHIGLEIMAERMKQIGGALTIDSCPGGGTRIECRAHVRDA